MSNDTDRSVTHGTTNVFADLGLPDAVERLTKTRLAKQVNELLEERRLKQVEAGRVLGVPRSKVSGLANYRLDGFSVEELMGFLTMLNQDVEILIRPSPDARSPGRVTVHTVR
jgi:predicted XRE-type DNA-binding protein